MENETGGTNTDPITDPRLANLRPPWKQGESGNPSGRPKKKPITEMYEEILGNPEEMDKIRASVVKALVKGNMAMVLQLREMTDRVEGKVTQPIEADITVNIADAVAAARKRAGMVSE